MGQGQKPGAAQSLADASKELDKLMQQMGDAKSLMAELDALNKASLAIGDCDGNCNSDGDRWSLKPGTKTHIGHGGQPGRGVGTWATKTAAGVTMGSKPGCGTTAA